MLTENQLVQAFNAERNGAKFPIDFDNTWQSLGYNKKSDAKKAIVNNLIEGEDYVIETLWDLLQNESTKLTECACRRILSTIGFSVEKGKKYTAREKSTLMKIEVISLSTDGYDHFCMMARTEEGREARKLFIQYKKIYLANLERALLGEINPEMEALKQRVTELEAKIGATISDRLEFPYSSKQLHRDSRIASHSYVVGAIKRDFIEGQDYQIVENELFMTEQMYLGFMLSFRSEKGADISALPDTLLIITKFFFQFQQARSKKNARVAQSDRYKQMELLEYN
jgi:hypothetical protein